MKRCFSILLAAIFLNVGIIGFAAENEAEFELITEEIIEEITEIPLDSESEPIEEEISDEFIEEILVSEDVEEIAPVEIAEEINDIEPIPDKLPPRLWETAVSVDERKVSIQLYGENLYNQFASIRIEAVGTNAQPVYMRQLLLNRDSGDVIEAELPHCASQLFRLTVDTGFAGREEKLFICGEADKLDCVKGVTGISISSEAEVKAEQNITVKISEENGELVYARRLRSDSSGRYSLYANFGIDKIKNYIVCINEGLSGKMFVKTVGYDCTEEPVTEKSCTVKTSVGEVIVYGKNLTDTSQYIYELSFNRNELSPRYINLIGSSIHIVSADSERILFMSDNRCPDGRLWSGILNAVMFDKLCSGEAEVTLKIYNLQ